VRPAPVAIDPDIRLDPFHCRVHQDAGLHASVDSAPLAHALRAGIADPDVGRRAGDIDAGAAEDTQYQGDLQQLQQAGETHRKHRWQKASPFVDERLAGERHHQGVALSASDADAGEGGAEAVAFGASAFGKGAPPSALNKAT
jgi:hypothetical protein